MLEGLAMAIVVKASIDNATLELNDTPYAMRTDALFGKGKTPTPEGVYTLKRAYSTRLKKHILVFKKEDKFVWAIHSIVDVPGQNRWAKLRTVKPTDNHITNGCINIPEKAFRRLWLASSEKTLILEVY